MRLFVVITVPLLWGLFSQQSIVLVANAANVVDSTFSNGDIANLQTIFDEKIQSIRAARQSSTPISNGEIDRLNPLSHRPTTPIHVTSVVSTTTVQVGAQLDGAADPSQCDTSTMRTTCTLRSAWAKCLSVVAASPCSNPLSCTVVLPTNQTFAFDGTLGALSVTNVALATWTQTCTSTAVTLSIASSTAGNLAARIVGDSSSTSFVAAQGLSTISLALAKVNIVGFGDASAAFQGALYVDGMGGLTLDHVVMSGCNGVMAAAVNVNNMAGVTFSFCTFKDNRLIDSADSASQGGAGVVAMSCQVCLCAPGS